MREKANVLLDSDDPLQLLLAETAQQLRDDTFVVLTHLSVTLDVFDLPDHIAYPIFNGLLHWAISSVCRCFFSDFLNFFYIKDRHQEDEII